MSEITVAPRQLAPPDGPARKPPHRRPRGSHWSVPVRLTLAATLMVFSWGLVGCGLGTTEPSSQGAAHLQASQGQVAKTPALERAKRRLFDGAPPVIPHPPLGAACSTCHHAEGVEVPNLGIAPPSPHAGFGPQTAGMSAISRCRQCHVFQQTEEVFVANDFVGLQQDLRRGRRLNALAPPVIPHRVFMREACLACHGGPAAREAIRTSHPERTHCLQCHLEQTRTTPFDPGSSPGTSTIARSAP